MEGIKSGGGGGPAGFGDIFSMFGGMQGGKKLINKEEELAKKKLKKENQL